MALNRGNERLPCLQPKIRSGNGRPVFSRSGNRTIARTFYAVDKSLRGGAWNQCMLVGKRTCFESDGSWEKLRIRAKKNVCLSATGC